MDNTSTTPRKPFVESVLKGAGKGFLVGAVGSYLHFSKYDLHAGAFCKNVARVSCSAAVCFGAYSAIDHAMVSARGGKEEPLLDCAVAAGGASAITALPWGVRRAGALALIGGAVGGVVFGGLRHLEGPRRNPSPQAQKTGDPGLPGDAARRGR